MGRLNLFDDGADSPDDLSKIKIKHDYARRYDYNKKREDLHRLEELKKQCRVDSGSEDVSSEEEEDLTEPSKKADSKFFDVLIRVKKQDPTLLDKDAKLFDSEDDDDSEDSGEDVSSEEEDLTKPSKKADSKFFDVLDRVKKQDPTLLDKDAKLFDSEDEDDSEDSGEECGEKKKKPIHLRTLNAKQLLEFGAYYNGEEDDGENVKTYTEEQEDEESKFLKGYFRGRMWIDDKKSNIKDYVFEVSEDEEEFERQEVYERDFNFRYEENAGDRILGHSRKIEGSVRKKENARKSQRERKEERMLQAEFARKEELKRLKNLKKKEINEKLEKIREVAGIGKDDGVFLDDDDLEGEFDPEAYDRKMKAAFGDGYYDANDADPGFGTDDNENEEKPDFDKEDELLGLEKGWDEANGLSGDGFLSTRDRILKETVDVIDEAKEGKRKRKRKPSEVEKAVKNELLEEYYKLDYEGTIGDLKTRFKYRPVVKRKFGLRPEDVLMLDDKELNEYVSLKKIAPYMEQEWKVPRIKTVQLKQKLWGEVRKEKGKAVEKEELGSESESKGKSRKAQRRHRKAELKLPHQRLLSYGKIPPQAKSKKKQRDNSN